MMLTVKQKELVGKVEALGKKLEELGKLPTRTAEQETEFDTAILQFTEAREAMEREAKASRAIDQYQELRKSTGSVTEVVSPDDARQLLRGPSEVRGRDHRTIGQRFAESKQVKDWLAKGGREGLASDAFSMGPAPVLDAEGKPVAGEAPRFTYDGAGPIDRFTLIETGLFPSFMPAPQVLPNIIRPNDYALTMRQVLAGGRTTTDTIYFLRELVFTNNAAETAQATAFNVAALGTEGRKPESNLTFEQASTDVKTIAHWVPITKQAIADVAQLQSYVENRLLVGLERRLNSQVINGDGSGATLTGILNTSGILTLNDAYFSGLSPALPDDSDVNAWFNRIEWGRTVIEVASESQATFVALHPYDLARMRMFTNGNRDYLAGSPFIQGGIPTIYGLPVARDRAVTQGTALVGDGTMAMIFDREDANISIGWVNDQFTRNMITILAELRAALAVFRPAAFAVVTLPSTVI